MVITSTAPMARTFRPTANAAPQPAQQAQAPEQQQQTQQAQGQPAQQPKGGIENPDVSTRILENLTSSPEFTKKVLSKMGNGDQVTITVNGEQVIQIKNESPGIMNRFIKGSQMFITAAAEEAANLVQADPAFAFKEAALGVKTQVYSGLPTSASEFAENAFLPMLRITALVLDTKKAMDTWKNKDADRATQIIDTAHVVTDVVGVIGALGDKFVPALAPYAPTMTAIGLAGDIAAYSYHVLQYLRERGQVNLHNQNENMPKQPEQQPIQASVNNQGNIAA